MRTQWAGKHLQPAPQGGPDQRGHVGRLGHANFRHLRKGIGWTLCGRHVQITGPYGRNGAIPLPNGDTGLQRLLEPRGSFSPASNHVAAALDAEYERRTQAAVAAWIPAARPAVRASVRVPRAVAPSARPNVGPLQSFASGMAAPTLMPVAGAPSPRELSPSDRTLCAAETYDGQARHLE